MIQTKDHTCCAPMADALREGDIFDNARLVRSSVPRRDLRIWNDKAFQPPTINFCPWCAAPIVEYP
jgi:hypothetical protein